MRLIVLAVAAVVCAWAHVGSPDIFLEGNAGPYAVFVTVRPPVVIPGVAEVEIRLRNKDAREVRIAPTPMLGPGAKLAPTPDIARRSKDDPRFFTGSLWMMTSGSWQVRVAVDGAEGVGELAVPVPALANRTGKMSTGLGAILAILGAILAAGAISIVGAATREAELAPGVEAGASQLRRSRIRMAVAAVAVAAIFYFGNDWWNSEAQNYTRIVYKPMEMQASAASNETLKLNLSDPGWLPRKVDDFLPDHGHLMHLYVIRLPEMERVWHLHPEMTAPGEFRHPLPPMPAGRYGLYADVVHESGLPETLVAEIDMAEIRGRRVEGDDSAGVGHPLSEANFAAKEFPLGDGAKMIFDREVPVYPVKRPYAFRFRVQTADGKPASDMELYMGMPGHAAFVKRDRTVFAHMHPTGSVPMAALELARKASGAVDPHAGHSMSAALPAEVSFPYGFPQPGEYRIFVQIRRAGGVQTGFFDVKVQ